jgi:hypothetical protein
VEGQSLHRFTSRMSARSSEMRRRALKSRGQPVARWGGRPRQSRTVYDCCCPLAITSWGAESQVYNTLI